MSGLTAVQARSVAWDKALSDGRVIRLNEYTYKSYPTHAMRDQAISDYNDQGIAPVIVNPGNGWAQL